MCSYEDTNDYVKHLTSVLGKHHSQMLRPLVPGDEPTHDILSGDFVFVKSLDHVSFTPRWKGVSGATDNTHRCWCGRETRMVVCHLLQESTTSSRECYVPMIVLNRRGNYSYHRCIFAISGVTLILLSLGAGFVWWYDAGLRDQAESATPQLNNNMSLHQTLTLHKVNPLIIGIDG